MIDNKTIFLLGIIIIVVILISIFNVGGCGSCGTKETFYAYYKDKQKVGNPAKGETDEGKQPRSTFRMQDFNYETCYGTDKVSANNIPRTGTFFCDNMGLGEKTPLAGLYPIDFTNYNISYQKIAKGSRLSGTYTVDGSTYNFDEYGRPTSEHMTLQRSKQVCDALGTKCAGFIFQYPGKRDNYQARQTYFISKLEDGMEDPYTYDMKLLGPEMRNQNKYHLTSWYQFDSYRKLDPYYKEVPMKELKVSDQDYEKRTCSIEQNPDYDLDYMTGTLDDCIARCSTGDNCTGFNRDAKAKDTDVAACQLKRVNFDGRVQVCPTNFKSSGGECVAGWSWSCGEDCARNNCSRAGGTWIPKDYSRDPYTCRMPESARKPICENAPNRAGLLSYVRKQVPKTEALVNIQCPFPYQDAPKLNFYLVSSNLYQPCRAILSRPADSDLMVYGYPGTPVDEQWYTVGLPNRIAEQIQDFILYHLQGKPGGSKICARFTTRPGSLSDGSILTAENMGNNQYRTELYSQEGKLYSTWYWSKYCNPDVLMRG